jgi:hypothetical protein
LDRFFRALEVFAGLELLLAAGAADLDALVAGLFASFLVVVLA